MSCGSDEADAGWAACLTRPTSRSWAAVLVRKGSHVGILDDATQGESVLSDR